jgi:hypothetical protein
MKADYPGSQIDSSMGKEIRCSVRKAFLEDTVSCLDPIRHQRVKLINLDVKSSLGPKLRLMRIGSSNGVSIDEVTGGRERRGGRGGRGSHM